MSYRLTSAKIIDTIVDTYFSFIRALLVIFQVLNNLCYIIGGVLCFGFALYIEADLAQQAPIWNVVAFLVAWLGIALECDAFAQLEAWDAGMEPSMPIGLGIAGASAEIGAAPMSAKDRSRERRSGRDRLNDNVSSADWLDELLKPSPSPIPRTPISAQKE